MWNKSHTHHFISLSPKSKALCECVEGIKPESISRIKTPAVFFEILAHFLLKMSSRRVKTSVAFGDFAVRVVTFAVQVSNGFLLPLN